MFLKDLLPGPSTKPNISPNIVHALAQTAMECKRKKSAAAVLVEEFMKYASKMSEQWKGATIRDFSATPENDDKEYSVSIGVHLDILEDPESTGC